MDPPYPTEIPPLLPEFLQRRRAKLTFALEKTEELGIDRATFIFVINLSYRGDRGASGEPGDLMSAYATIPDRWLPMAAAARGAGLVEERGARWYLTNKGRQLAGAMHDAARSHYASLSPLPRNELAELARLLDRAFRAGADAPEPRVRLHTPFAFAYRGEEPPDGSFAQLDAAVYGLWQVRDDCHMTAWRGAGLNGPRRRAPEAGVRKRGRGWLLPAHFCLSEHLNRASGAGLHVRRSRSQQVYPDSSYDS